MFFDVQNFDSLDISDYSKNATSIPKTHIWIYEFECADNSLCEEEKANKLDRLSQQLMDKYKDLFQIVNSESSQYYCRQLYPLVVEFETKLRYALYISRALFEAENVNKDSFLYEIEKKNKKSVEEMDFGIVYEVFFTDRTLKSRLHQEYDSHLTKTDLLKIIENMEEKTIWSDCVGDRYNFISTHFLAIKTFRNHVMHNHLIGNKLFQEAKETFAKANAELEKAISDKLIVNESKFLNTFDILRMLSERIASQQIELFTEQAPRSLELIGQALESLTIKSADIFAASESGTNPEDEISQFQEGQIDDT